MIKINLLHVRAKRRSAPGQSQLIVAALGVLLAVLGAWYWDQTTQAEVDGLDAQIQTTEAETKRIIAEIGDVRVLAAQKTELESDKKAIQDLTNNRQNPVWVLHELSKILTKDHEPSYLPAVYEEIKRKDPQATYDPSWDPKSLWINSFVEKEKGITVSGGGRTQDDIAEFVKRLSVSVFFHDVRLVSILRSSKTLASGPKVDFYEFSLTATVTY